MGKRINMYAAWSTGVARKAGDVADANVRARGLVTLASQLEQSRPAGQQASRPACQHASILAPPAQRCTMGSRPDPGPGPGSLALPRQKPTEERGPNAFPSLATDGNGELWALLTLQYRPNEVTALHGSLGCLE